VLGPYDGVALRMPEQAPDGIVSTVGAERTDFKGRALERTKIVLFM
jgi:hypothetical protein